MKKYLPVVAALALTGCVHSQFESAYLQEYASHDCSALELQMQAALAEAKQVGKMIRSSNPKGYQLHTVGSAQITVFGPKPHHKDRMRTHARQQAILQLLSTQGCRNSNPDANIGPHTSPNST
ncbi:MAG: hypothetical protein F4Z95_03150 [Gammaproteobacteria bacterium]|nr:hypothetical protein [Gammaproteobacteria bacterium]